MQAFDSKINEGARTLARVTSWSSGPMSGLWGFESRLPKSSLKNFKTLPGSDVTPIYVTMNNIPEAAGYLGRQEKTVMGQAKLGSNSKGYLFYTSFQNTGKWLPDNLGQINSMPNPNFNQIENYSKFKTSILTDVTRAQDTSGNTLRVDLEYTHGGLGGAYYPFNDAVGDYSLPLGDNARQLYLFGRVGQGVGCSSDARILISEQSGISRAGTLQDYDKMLSVQFWVKPLLVPSTMILARAPAYTVSLLADRKIEIRVRLENASQPSSPYERVSVTNDALELGNWYHIAADFNVDATEHTITSRLFINGALAMSQTSGNIAGLTRLFHDSSPWHFCAGGPGVVANHALNIDEAGVTNRLLSTEELRTAAMIEDPELAPERTASTQAALLGPLFQTVADLGFDFLEANIPQNNPVTAEKIALGSRLFFDPNLSLDHTVSCASCHSPSTGYGSTRPDGKGVGINEQISSRAPNRLINLLFSKPETGFNWDARAPSLEDQAKGPLTSATEMGMATLQAVENRVRSFGGNYGSLVQSAFGHGLSQVTELEIRQALASFLRSLLAGNSPFDRYQVGDASALTASQKVGMGVFAMNCVGCHQGAGLTNHQTFNIGLFPETIADQGRYAITHNIAEKSAFKTPGLRDLHLREGKGFGHDGSITTLEQVVSNYQAGGLFQTSSLAREIHAISLSPSELNGLLDFLRNALRTPPPYNSIYSPTP